MKISQIITESHATCPECGGPAYSDPVLAEKKDACYHKVKASAKVWPSAYASGRLVQCRKKGAANYGNKSEGVAEGSLNELAPSPGFGGDDDDDKYTPADYGKPFKANYLGQNKFEVFCRKPQDPSNVIKLNAEVQKYGLEWEDDFGFWFLDSPGAVYLSWKYGEIPLPKAIDQARNPGHIHDLVVDYLSNSPHAAEIQKIATEYFGFTADGEMNEGVAEDLSEEFDLIESIIEGIAEHNGVDAETVWADLESLTEDELYAFAVTSQLNEDWQKANKRDRTDGMSQKAVNAYRRENPGSKLKTAVTTKPSKLKKGGKASKRRKSYCSRSRGQMKMHSISCAKTPDKAICKARRRWNC